MKLSDYIHFYLGCKCVLSFVAPDHSEYNKGWKLISIESQSDKPYEIDNGTEYTWTADIKPILRRLDSMTEEERREYEATLVIQKASPVHQFGVRVQSAQSFAWLCSRGFDLFSLIDSNQAIDATKQGQ
jgi:hypothetical protein